MDDSSKTRKPESRTLAYKLEYVSGVRDFDTGQRGIHTNFVWNGMMLQDAPRLFTGGFTATAGGSTGPKTGPLGGGSGQPGTGQQPCAAPKKHKPQGILDGEQEEDCENTRPTGMLPLGGLYNREQVCTLLGVSPSSMLLMLCSWTGFCTPHFAT